VANDIENLLSGVGATAEGYLEVNDFHEYRQPETVGNAEDSEGRGVHALAAPRHASLRSLLEELARERKEGAERRTAARVIAVVSMNGGSGKSTLSTALLGAVNGAGRHIAIDLDPQDALRHHLGVDASGDDGSVGVAAADWKAGLLEGYAGVQVLPYGAVSTTQQRALEHTLAEEPKWLVRKLAAMHLDREDVVVLDTPPGRTPYLEQALLAADQVVTVVTPDAASFMVLDQTEQVFERVLGENAATRCVYVVNQFDATRAFHRDMLEILRRGLGERLIGVVPFDEKVAEGLALGTCPLLNASTSRARQAVEGIGQVLRSRLKVSVTHGHAS